jgi:threonine dehydrogenase-like Zn-dependent dehydrogenase
MIASGTLIVRPLITHFYDFKDAIKAFDFAATMPDEAIKTMVRM